MQIQAQTTPIANPSPDAANLGCVGNIPISLHTGMIKPTINLFDYTENGFRLLANLGYNMSGARPDLRAGWVGRNWNLSVGGVITRVINGKPDETSGGAGYLYCADKINDLNWLNTNTDEFVEKYDGYFMGKHGPDSFYDQEPDDFYFEANGISGHFFIGKNRKIHVVGQPNIKVEIDFDDKVEYTYCETFYKMRVIMDDGTVYHYGGNVDIIESSQAYIEDGGSPSYANAWHLNKITLPNGREVKFKYTQRYSDNSFSMTYLNVFPGCYLGEFSEMSYPVNTFMAHCYLKSIESDNIKIDFNISNFAGNLKNENWKKLDEIVILDKLQTQIVKRHVFSYSGDYLMKLQEFGSDPSIVVPSYKFDYNGRIDYRANDFVAMPNRDVWGYYKANCSKYFPESLVATDGVTRYFTLDKQPSLRSTQTGILQAIEYPSGGIVEFEYELNDYSMYYEYSAYKKGLFHVQRAYGDADQLKITELKNGDVLEVAETIEAYVYFVDEALTKDYAYSITLSKGVYNKAFFFNRVGLSLPSHVMESYRFRISYQGLSPSMNEKCGGLRIRSITYKENRNKIIKIADYIYSAGYRNGYNELTAQSSGVLGCKPVFEYAFTKNGGKALWSIPVSTAQLTDGSPVGYSEVTEVITDGEGVQQGYITYFYSTFSRWPDLEPTFCWTNISGDTGARDSQAHKRGQLERKEVHANDDRISQIVIYFYRCINADTVIALKMREVPAMKINYSRWLFGSFSACNKYSISNLLVKEQRYDYPISELAEPVEQCIKYRYNEYNQIIEKDIKNSSGNHQVIQYKYPQDFVDVNSSDENDVHVKMFNKHMIAPVIEEVRLKNSLLVEKVRAEYRFENEVPYLYSSAKSYDPVSDNFQADVYNTKCDSRGNILCSMLANGLQTVYLWGYNYRYPVAIIENATQAEVESITGTLESYAAQPSPDLSKIELLRKELKQARITSYTYKPCVGVLTETDIANHTLYYEYDALGRLTSVSDENHNKMNAYKYHHRRTAD